MPDDMRLWIAMQQQEWWSFSADHSLDPNAITHVYLVVFETRKEITSHRYSLPLISPANSWWLRGAMLAISGRTLFLI